MKNKSLSKINSSIKELIKTCLDLDSIESFNTRDKYIVAKIKFYNWLNEEDVETICEKLLLDVNTILEIKDKFNEKFLYDFYINQSSFEIEYLKEVYEDNVDIENYGKILSLWNKCQCFTDTNSCIEKYPDYKYYINYYWKKVKRYKSNKSWKKYVHKLESYQEWLNRRYIDKFEVWQFGRCGGWLSICKESELEFTYLDDSYYHYYIDLLLEETDNDKFNSIFNKLEEDKYKFLSNLKSEYNYHLEKIQAIKSIIDNIESMVKNYKTTLLDLLENEIQIFLNPNQSC